jgi:hypothetical protein
VTQGLPVVPTISDFPELYDTLTISGMRSPGTVKLSGDALKVKVDKAEAKSSDGGTSTINGRSVREFEAEFYVWNDREKGVDHHVAWAPFYAMLFTQSAAPKAIGFPIVHPDLARAGITSVCVEHIALPTYDGKGGARHKVKFSEHKPKKPSTAGSVVAGAGIMTGPVYDPNADLKAILEARIAQWNAP